MKRIPVIVIVAAFLFTTCKKYPEGPLISLRTKKQRVTGTYALEKYLVNGFDSTNLLNNTVYYPTFDETHYFFRSYMFSNDRGTNYYGSFFEGTWELKNNKENLYINPLFQDTSLVVYYEILTPGNYKLLRLTNNEIWLEDTKWNFVRQIYLRKISNND